MKTIRVVVSSYKKAQVFKRDYVRPNGQFLRFRKSSGNHSYVELDLAPGEEFDVRGSKYVDGATRWTAANCQSWSRFRNENGELKAHDFDGNPKPLPHWVRVSSASTPCAEPALSLS